MRGFPRYACYMDPEPTATYAVEEREGQVLVRGVSGRVVKAALETFDQLHEIRAETAAGARGDLIQALMASGVPLVPPASVAQAQRVAIRRDALLATPVYTYETLAQARGGAAPSSVRTWVHRNRADHAIFTVTMRDGTKILPAFQFDEHAEPAPRPRPELKPILEVLVEAGVKEWALWIWLTTPTSLLSGEVPERLARSNPGRVLHAAQRFAACNAA